MIVMARLIDPAFICLFIQLVSYHKSVPGDNPRNGNIPVGHIHVIYQYIHLLYTEMCTQNLFMQFCRNRYPAINYSQKLNESKIDTTVLPVNILNG